MESKGIIFGFVFGAAAGAVSAWYFSKKYYERIAQEEIDSVKEVFMNHHLTPVSKEEKEKVKEMARENREKPSIMEYSNMLKKEGYVDYSGSPDRGEERRPEKVNKLGKDIPYVISPDEFGENEDYEKISYTYYSDGVVTGDHEEIIRDVGETLGEDFMDHFGDYEEDSVHIRNDILGIDYEILYDDRTFEEVNGPRQMEGQ